MRFGIFSLFFFLGLHVLALSSPVPKPVYEIDAIGAATTGALVEGAAGATRQGIQRRFICRSQGPKPGFIGPMTVAKPMTIRSQPGIFPAPLSSQTALLFTFTCQDEGNHLLTPAIIKPDGTVICGFPMTAEDFPQTIEAPSAQTGIYTLFIIPHEGTLQNIRARVEIVSNENSPWSSTCLLQTFSNESSGEEVSAEFVYSPGAKSWTTFQGSVAQ